MDMAADAARRADYRTRLNLYRDDQPARVAGGE